MSTCATTSHLHCSFVSRVLALIAVACSLTWWEQNHALIKTVPLKLQRAACEAVFFHLSQRKQLSFGCSCIGSATGSVKYFSFIGMKVCIRLEHDLQLTFSVRASVEIPSLWVRAWQFLCIPSVICGFAWSTLFGSFGTKCPGFEPYLFEDL